MTDGVVYVARKGPFSQGGYDRVFRAFDDAQSFVEQKVDEEPNVEEAHWNEWEKRPTWTYRVDKGVGKVAGTVEEIPIAEGFDGA